MAFSGVLTTEAEIIAHAGSGISASVTDVERTAWCKQAEAYLCLLGKYDFVTNVGSLDAVLKLTLSEYCARYCAVASVQYDFVTTATATSITECEDRITVHLYRMRIIEKALAKQDYKDLMNTGL